MKSYQVTLNVLSMKYPDTAAFHAFLMEAHSLEDAIDKASSAAELCGLVVLSVQAESCEAGNT